MSPTRIPRSVMVGLAGFSQVIFAILLFFVGANIA
jgi:hypothetical protein